VSRIDNPRRVIQELGKELETEDNAAFDLWTWLPSYRAAKQHHGGYATEFLPSVTDIMREAATYIPLMDSDIMEDMMTVVELGKCPCGEDHS